MRAVPAILIVLLGAGCGMNAEPFALRSAPSYSVAEAPARLDRHAALNRPISLIHVTQGYSYGMSPAGPEMWYLNLAVLPLVTESGDANFIDAGAGFSLRSGWFAPTGLDLNGFGPRISFEVGWETSEHSYDLMPGVDATHNRFLIGARLVDPRFQRGRPYVTMGFAFHTISFTNLDPTFDIDGEGFYFGAGGEVPVAPGIFLGLGGEYHSWVGSDGRGGEGDIGTFELTMGVEFHF